MMNKESLTAQITERYQALAEALKGSDIELIRRLALEVHAMVHPAEVSGLAEPTIADHVWDYLAAGHQSDPVRREIYDTDLHYAGTKTVPLIWQFWHTYRIEDLVTNLLMTQGSQIFNEDWQRRIGASIVDTGNALETEEAAAFGRSLNPEALRAYMLEVGRNTRRILEGLTLEQVRGMPSDEEVMRIYEEGGVTSDLRSVWLLVFWGRLTRGGMILTPLTYHHMMHLPPCLDSLPILPQP